MVAEGGAQLSSTEEVIFCCTCDKDKDGEELCRTTGLRFS